MARSILAVLAGFAVWTVLWLGSNAALAAAFPAAYNPDGATESAGILLALLALSVGFSVVAGYRGATLAREKPRPYALALGVLLLVVGIGVQLQYWAVMPLWYHVLFLVLLVPGVLMGARARLGKAVQTGFA